MNKSLLNGIIAGSLAGVAGALAMNLFQSAAARAGGGREVDDATIGIPRGGRGPQPAQALGNASDDSTARVANVAMSAIGYPLGTARAKQRAGAFVHLAFGAITGALYGAAVEMNPRMRSAAGLPFGLAVWALADEAIVPALGVKAIAARILCWPAGLQLHLAHGLWRNDRAGPQRNSPPIEWSESCMVGRRNGGAVDTCTYGNRRP